MHNIGITRTHFIPNQFPLTIP